MKKTKKNSVPRTKTITIRVTEDLYDTIKIYADFAELSVAEFLRREIFGEKIIFKIKLSEGFDEREIIVKDMHVIGKSLNKIAHTLNEGEDFSIEIYNEVVDLIQDIYAELRKPDS